MKNLKSLLILALTSSMAFAIGCKDKEPKELLVNSWKVKELKWAEANKMPDSVTNEIVDHTVINFTADNTYTFVGEAGTIQAGTYTLSDDGKVLTLTTAATGAAEVNKIKELSAGKLVFVDAMGNEFTTAN